MLLRGKTIAFVIIFTLTNTVPLSSTQSQGPHCDKCIRWITMFNASLWVFCIAGKSK